MRARCVPPSPPAQLRPFTTRTLPRPITLSDTARSFGLVGALEKPPEGGDVSLGTALNCVERMFLGALRFFSAWYAATCGGYYLLVAIIHDFASQALGAALYGPIKTPAMVWAAALVTPFVVAGVLTIRDLLRQIYAVKSPCVKVASVVLVLVFMMLLNMLTWSVVTVLPAVVFSPGYIEVILPATRFLIFGCVNSIAFTISPSRTTEVTPSPTGVFCPRRWLPFLVFVAVVSMMIKPGGRPSRVALLYDKYFGLSGEVSHRFLAPCTQATTTASLPGPVDQPPCHNPRHAQFFHYKVIAFQYCTVLLQALAKLPMLGALVTNHPIGGTIGLGRKGEGEPNANYFWFYGGVLLINAVYPSLLLVSSRCSTPQPHTCPHAPQSAPSLLLTPPITCLRHPCPSPLSPMSAAQTWRDVRVQRNAVSIFGEFKILTLYPQSHIHAFVHLAQFCQSLLLLPSLPLLQHVCADAVLDLCYSFVYFQIMIRNGIASTTLPVDVLGYLSAFTPAMVSTHRH